jgi:hypothetical protein
MTQPVSIHPSWGLSKLRAELKHTRDYLARAHERKYGETDAGIERATGYKLRLEEAISAKENRA